MTVGVVLCVLPTSRSKDSYNKKRRLERQEDPQANSMQCIGILPGLGTYADSSDSEQSSDTDQETVPTLAVDLLGRKIVQAVLKNKSSSGSGRSAYCRLVVNMIR
uniref:Uncharacterized protein n=1 Tax=Timema shepardi TaxID=629360 RepID=A0A7R9BBJ6_TIMSH|nr:unnamed protein product [Timema shepardi]